VSTGSSATSTAIGGSIASHSSGTVTSNGSGSGITASTLPSTGNVDGGARGPKYTLFTIIFAAAVFLVALYFLVVGLIAVSNLGGDPTNIESAKAAHLGAFYTALIGVVAAFFTAYTFESQQLADKSKEKEQARRIAVEEARGSMSHLDMQISKALVNPGILRTLLLSGLPQLKQLSECDVSYKLPFYFFKDELFGVVRFENRDVLANLARALSVHTRIALLSKSCYEAVLALLQDGGGESLSSGVSHGFENSLLNNVSARLENLITGLAELAKVIRSANFTGNILDNIETETITREAQNINDMQRNAVKCIENLCGNARFNLNSDSAARCNNELLSFLRNVGGNFDSWRQNFSQYIDESSVDSDLKRRWSLFVSNHDSGESAVRDNARNELGSIGASNISDDIARVWIINSALNKIAELSKFCETEYPPKVMDHYQRQDALNIGSDQVYRELAEHFHTIGTRVASNAYHLINMNSSLLELPAARMIPVDEFSRLLKQFYTIRNWKLASSSSSGPAGPSTPAQLPGGAPSPATPGNASSVPARPASP